MPQLQPGWAVPRLATIGDDLELDCPLLNATDGSVNWMKDGQALNSSSRALSLKAVDSQDAGLYVCECMEFSSKMMSCYLTNVTVT